MIIPMSKVQIIGPKKHISETVKEIHRMGCLHIIDVRKEPLGGEKVATPLKVDPLIEQKRSRVEQTIARLSGLISIALKDKAAKYENMRETNKLYQAYLQKDVDELLEIAEQIIAEVEEKPQKLALEKEEKEKQLALYSRYKTILGKVKPLIEKIVKLEGYDSTAIVVDKKFASVIDLLREEIGRITANRFEIVSAEVDKDPIAAIIVYPKEFYEPVHQLLWSENVTQIQLPEDLKDYSYADAISIMEQRIQSLPAEIEGLDRQIASYSDRYGSQLIAIRDALIDALNELSVVESFAETSYTFVITGWVPTRTVKKLEKTLATKFNGEVTVIELPVTEEEREEAPVVLENPRWAKPFELILGLFSLPKYGTIDPTPFLAIFYPLFFGIILGDVGYGLLLLVMAVLAARKWRVPAIRAGAYMVGFSGFMAVIFGFLYDEFFGFEFWHILGLHPFEVATIHIPFHRAKAEFAIAYLVFALGLGAGHLILGLILGLVNAIREKSVKHMVEKIGFLLLFLAAASIAGASLKQLPPVLAEVGAFAILVSVVLIIWGGGIIGAIHVFSVIGHFFSYLRIMALGLAGVVLAIIANSFTETFSNVVLGIAVAAIIHSLNIVLHTFSSTIHSIRLNILEFFDKFYESGGKPYKPFATRR